MQLFAMQTIEHWTPESLSIVHVRIYSVQYTINDVHHIETKNEIYKKRTKKLESKAICITCKNSNTKNKLRNYSDLYPNQDNRQQGRKKEENHTFMALVRILQWTAYICMSYACIVYCVLEPLSSWAVAVAHYVPRFSIFIETNDFDYYVSMAVRVFFFSLRFHRLLLLCAHTFDTPSNESYPYNSFIVPIGREYIRYYSTLLVQFFESK